MGREGEAATSKSEQELWQTGSSRVQMGQPATTRSLGPKALVVAYAHIRSCGVPSLRQGRVGQIIRLPFTSPTSTVPTLVPVVVRRTIVSSGP
jgi:hypothetical protein